MPRSSSIWQRVSTLGVRKDEAPGERRRLVLTNQSAVIGIGSSGSFVVGYAIAGSRFFAPMFTNVVAVCCFALALVLTRRGARTAAKLAVLVPCNVAVVVASLLGGRAPFVYYFFLFGVVAFLLFGAREVFFRWLRLRAPQARLRPRASRDHQGEGQRRDGDVPSERDEMTQCRAKWRLQRTVVVVSPYFR